MHSHIVERDVEEGTPFGEDHPPGNLSDSAIELTVNEISDSPQTQSNGGGDDKEVSNLPERLLIFPGKKNPNDENADQSSMERHSTMPDGKDLKGIGEVIFEIIEEDVPQTGSDDQPEDEIEVEILHL